MARVSRSRRSRRTRVMAELGASEIAELIAPLRVPAGSKVRLPHDFDPGYHAGFLNKSDGKRLLKRGVELLAEYQSRLAAQDTYGLLVVLQALDAGGKDGTIKHVMSGVNPQGVTVHSFKVPSATELSHDYLWRYAQSTPSRGQIGIFNRSHYEEVLVVRVHPENLDRQRLPSSAKDDGVWRRRYREINDWERYLSDNGFRTVKILLNISKEEQRLRFLKRLDRPDKKEILVRRCHRARVLGRLPAGVLRDAQPHQHVVGTLVRDPGGPQVVRAHLRVGDH